MGRFWIEDVEVFFPYDNVYPEQLEYMSLLKATLDAKGHCVLEMPTGTGKTVALLSLITSYAQSKPVMTGRLVYCTRTVPEMEKVLVELKEVMSFRRRELARDGQKEAMFPFMGSGLSARRNLCIHPKVNETADREKIDEVCLKMTAPWVRRKAYAEQKRATPFSSRDTADIEDLEAIGCESCNDTSGLCGYYENFERIWNANLLPSDVYTLEDLRNTALNFRLPNKPDVPYPFCPYFAARRMVQFSNVVVLNYQYVLDPKVSTAAHLVVPTAHGPGPATSEEKFRFAKNLNSKGEDVNKTNNIIVFDEAHNIDNVCIEAFSVDISMLTLEKARKNLNSLEKAVEHVKNTDQARLLKEYDSLLQGLRTTGQLDDELIEGLSNPVLPDDITQEAIPGNIRKAEFFVSVMRRVILYFNVYIRVFTVKSEGPLTFLRQFEAETNISPRTLKFCYQRLQSLLTTLQMTNLDDFAPLNTLADFCTLVGTYWEGFIIIVEPYPEAAGIYDPLLQLSCLDSSLAIKPVFQQFQSVIVTSGTISPLTLYPKLLGFEPVITYSLPMSLDRKCICPLIITKSSTQVQLSSRFETREDLAVIRGFGELLVELTKAVPDGIVGFFPSYQYMELVISKWYETGILAEVMQQKLVFIETTDVVATTLALHNYRKACDFGRGAVFLSVARGKVAEGIDFDRHYGRCVTLFGIPFQYTLSRILKARLDFVRENYQVPENEFLTFDAMRQAAQCVGRVIRSKTDYGLMIFADCRYSRLDKRQKLPEWINAMLDPRHISLPAATAIHAAKKFLLTMSQPVELSSASLIRASDDKLAKSPTGIVKIKQKNEEFKIKKP
eukprot:GHVP01055207.1.p1 GENE.GHVP01055207.1~~GHVP01055207.1.p1  ORF type:complete len:839 (+),score=130.82 GHVP01055207.1:868-3384(+)